MCSRYAETQCCVCRRFLDKSNSRIIVEICGHQKCRECFIKEEDGCSLCSQSKQRNANEIDSGSGGDTNSLHPILSNAEVVDQRNDEDKAAQIPAEIDEFAAHIVTTNGIGDAVRYKCTICQKTFKSRNNRKYHLFCDKSRSKPFQCNQCDKQFITLAHLNYHQSTHNADKHHLSCPHCQKVYSGEIALKKHLRKHQNDLKYQCTQCDEKFLYKEQLNIHQNRHNNVFHKCLECGKRFLIKSNLTKHIQSHSGLNRKICPICKNSFSGNSALKTHMLTHSKVKPHQCEKCSKKFIDQRTLERHSKTHLDSEFYECTLCSAKSGRKDNIRRHVRNLHAESEDELRLILQKIFDNFANKKGNGSTAPIENKTERSEAATKTVSAIEKNVGCEQHDVNAINEVIKEPEMTAKSPDVVRNIATSVIKFVGRVQDVQPAEREAQSENANQNESTKSATAIRDRDEPETVVSKPRTKSLNETITSTLIQTIDPEIAVNLPSLEPLSFDQFPDIAPLPLLNTNTNLNVYRQLLSPYLRKPAEPTRTDTGHSVQPIDSPQSTQTNKLKSGPTATTVVIDRPPKKMIDKYEIFRK